MFPPLSPGGSKGGGEGGQQPQWRLPCSGGLIPRRNLAGPSSRNASSQKTPHVLAAETRKQTDRGKQRCLCLSAWGICSLPGYKGWQLQEGFSPGRQLKKQRLRPQPANWCSLSERCFLAVLGFLSLSSSGRRNCTACTYLLCFV